MSTRDDTIKRRPRAGDYVTHREIGGVYYVASVHGGRNAWVSVEPTEGTRSTADLTGEGLSFPVRDVRVFSAAFVADWSL